MRETDQSVVFALRVAFRHFNAETTTEVERDHILRALTMHADSREAEAASRALFHRNSARTEQLTIASLLAQKDEGEK